MKHRRGKGCEWRQGGGREFDRTIGSLGGLGEIIARVLSRVPGTWWEASISS